MVEICIRIPKYTPETGLKAKWEDDFALVSSIQDGTFTIKGNRAGLVSLANQILSLTQEGVPSGAHWHLNRFENMGALNQGSSELIIALDDSLIGD